MNLFIVYAHGTFSFFLRLLDWISLMDYNNALTDSGKRNFCIYACHPDSPTPYIKDGYICDEKMPPNSLELFGRINIWEHLFEPIIEYNHSEVWSDNNTKWIDNFPYNPINHLLEPEFKDLQVPDIHMKLFNTTTPYYWNTPDLYKHPQFNMLRQYYNKLIQKYIKPKNTLLYEVDKIFEKKKAEHRWLGIHLRIPKHHYIDMNDNEIENYYNWVVQSIIPLINELNVHRIFVATESLELIEKLQLVCGKDNVYFHEIPRLRGNHDWNMRSEKTYRISYLEECKNSYLDVYTLSKCDVIIGACSNMFTSALFINPNNDFRIIPCLERHAGA